MILEGFKFSINLLKDNFNKLISIVSIPIVFELILNSFSSISEIEGDSITFYLVTTAGLLIQTWAQCMLIIFATLYTYYLYTHIKSFTHGT